MQRLFVFIAAVLVARGASTDLPVYCRLLQVGLEAATYQPVLEDVNLSIVEHVPLLGDVDISVSHLEIASVKVSACGASADKNGVFNVGFRGMEISLQQLSWQYRQRSWPHTYDFGDAQGSTGASFNVSIDMSRDGDHLFLFHLDEIDVKLGAKHHPWLTSALMKLAKVARPLLSMIVQHEAKKALDSSLAVIRTQGGCAFLENTLKQVDFVTFSFTSYQPHPVHVPLIGDIDVSVNSTYIHPPTSMQCEHMGFNGTLLQAHIEHVPFSAGFKWGYQKPGSSFWHNQGNGTTSVVAGAVVTIDLLKPTATYIKVDLPELKLQIDAETHRWLYHALTSVMVPLIRESLQLFGGRFLAHEINKCLEDPSCPRMTPKKQSSQGSQSTGSSVAASILV